jgi:hypothetical protein
MSDEVINKLSFSEVMLEQEDNLNKIFVELSEMDSDKIVTKDTSFRYKI